MGLFDRFRGTDRQRPFEQPAGMPDDAAIARYRYMLRTAAPETIEQAHAEAFARLSPEQRRLVLAELANEIPEAERAAAARAVDDPGELARVATRAEIRRPGVMERAFGGVGAAPGAGGVLAGSFLASMAGTVLGSVIAQHFFASHPIGDMLHGERDATSVADDGATRFDEAADVDPGGDFVSGFDDGGTFDV